MVEHTGQRLDKLADNRAGFVGSTMFGNLKAGFNDSIDPRLIDFATITNPGKVGHQTRADPIRRDFPAR